MKEAIDHLLLEILTNQGPAESLMNRAPIHPLPEISEAVEEAMEEATEEADLGAVDTTMMTIPRVTPRTLIIRRHPEKEPRLEDRDALRLNSNYRSQKSSTESSLGSKNGCSPWRLISMLLKLPIATIGSQQQACALPIMPAFGG